jgi:hypothetical protein
MMLLILEPLTDKSASMTLLPLQHAYRWPWSQTAKTGSIEN